MILRSLALLPLFLLPGVGAAAHQSGSLWNAVYQNGIVEYSTGAWDRPTGAALLLSCAKDGTVSVAAQIKGQTPPAGTALRLSASSRSGTRESVFRLDSRGGVALPATSAAIRTLWANLRWGDILTLRYADGRQAVLSLAGAAKTLPATPCG